MIIIYDSFFRKGKYKNPVSYYPGILSTRGNPRRDKGLLLCVSAAVITAVEAASVVKAAAVKTAVEGAVVAGKAVHESAALCSVVSAFPMPFVMSCMGSAGL